MRSGIDLSYSLVLMPAILAMLPRANSKNWNHLLDAGCGPGVLSEALAAQGWEVTGVDSAQAMIDIAKQDAGKGAHLRFVRGEMHHLPELFGNKKFDVAVANMSLTGTPKLTEDLCGVRGVLREGAKLVMTDVHPWFWRKYKGHDIPYSETTTLVEPFTISLDPEPLPEPTPVTYRTLEALSAALFEADFLIEVIEEPVPTPAVQQKYPNAWDYPRFLLLSARAT